jgi:threonine dehydrogenase-like Zn-dependent dehydrogenase
MASNSSIRTFICMGGPRPFAAAFRNWLTWSWTEKIEPGKVFDLELPLEKVAEGCAAMDERRAIKTLLHP